MLFMKRDESEMVRNYLISFFAYFQIHANFEVKFSLEMKTHVFSYLERRIKSF